VHLRCEIQTETDLSRFVLLNGLDELRFRLRVEGVVHLA
jgi:hypothetical protein